VITVGATTEMGAFAGFNSTPLGSSWRTFEPGDGADIHITFPVSLAGGTYRLIVDVKDGEAGERLARNAASSSRSRKVTMLRAGEGGRPDRGCRGPVL
jgi:hypothetical protein